MRFGRILVPLSVSAGVYFMSSPLQAANTTTTANEQSHAQGNPADPHPSPAPFVHPLGATPQISTPADFPRLSSDNCIHGIIPIEFTHPFPLPLCVSGFLTKYPNPKHCPEFLSQRVLEERRDDSTGIVYRKRHLTMKNTAPWLFRKLLHSDTVEFTEESLEDPRNGIFELYSQNDTFSSILTATEHSKFYSDPSNPESQTRFIQTGGIRCSKYFGPLRSPLEHFVTPRMRVAGYRACELLDQILHEKFDEQLAQEQINKQNK